MSGFKSCSTTVAALLLALLIVSPAAAQGRKKVKPSGPPTRLKQPAGFTPLQSRVRLKVLRAGTLSGDSQKELQALYSGYLTMLLDPQNQNALYKVRIDMRQDLITAHGAATKDAHQWVRDHLLAEMQKLAADAKLNMTVRANAMLVLADLNEAEYVVDGLTVVKPAVPMPEAFDVLMQTYEDAQAPPALRAVALKGLLRHAKLGIADAQKAGRLRTAMMKALADKKVPANVDPKAHEFLRRRAMETLGALKAPGVAAGDTSVLKAMTDALVEEKASVSFRTDAACNIGELKLTDAVKVDHGLIAYRLGTLAVDIAESQTEKRALVHHLVCVRKGLNGGSVDPKKPDPDGLLAAAAANPAQAKFIASLAEEVNKLTVAILKERDASKLPAHAQTHGKTIQQLLQANAPQGEQPKAPPPKAAKKKAPE